MKIAYLTLRRDPNDRRTWRSWSGTVYYVARALQRHCGEVSYLTPVLPCWKAEFFERVVSKVIYIVLRKRYTGALFLAKRYARAASRWLATNSSDVIVAPDGAFDIAVLETNIPIVLIGDSTHDGLLDYYPRYSRMLKMSREELQAVQRLAIQNASAVIYSSAWAAKSAIKYYGADPAKVHVIPFGANFDEIPPRKVALARSKSDKCRLLFLAVEWQRKGGDIAYETLLKLEEMGIQAELIVCGCTLPKTVAHEHIKIIPFLNKNDVRQRKELERLFLTSDFLLIPTRADCSPIVFCEASAFGLPVITTDTGGVSGIVKEGENGFLLSINDKGDVYARTIANIYLDEERYIALIRSSRDAFETRLNWDVWGVTVKQILTDLLAQKGSREGSSIFVGRNY